MADRILFIGWGDTVPGREERGLEVFNETIGFFGRTQEQGRIEKFDVVLFDPTGDLGGYMAVHGTAEQLAALRMDEEFRRNMVDASLVVAHLRLLDGATNAGVAQDIELYQQAITKVPQSA